ncbi:hypothetical protein [uncultured Thiodictyon sp.]|uniref:hypothetical protein n=1 Tax=uncultured Thiodictyon sp. TaxID=1846217 RepID=UPI0025EC6871|nr:hypothetical protein [uncultured Thiodictyon sp.]
MKDLAMRPNEPTVKEFYQDRYQRTSSVWVDDYGQSSNNTPYLIFSNTSFYPHGGGQKGDRGILHIPLEISQASGLPTELVILDTHKVDDFIHHFVEPGVDLQLIEEHLVGAQKFDAALNWEFRYTQMRLHTIAHLLHCFIEKSLGKELAFPSYSELKEAQGINRYPLPNLVNEDQFQDAVASLNTWMAGDHPIKIYANDDPEFPNWYRWWECDSWRIPCGGVHPANTNEVGNFKATLSSKKGNTTMTFELAA